VLSTLESKFLAVTWGYLPQTVRRGDAVWVCPNMLATTHWMVKLFEEIKSQKKKKFLSELFFYGEMCLFSDVLVHIASF